MPGKETHVNSSPPAKAIRAPKKPLLIFPSDRAVPPFPSDQRCAAIGTETRLPQVMVEHTGGCNMVRAERTPDLPGGRSF